MLVCLYPSINLKKKYPNLLKVRGSTYKYCLKSRTSFWQNTFLYVISFKEVKNIHIYEFNIN